MQRDETVRETPIKRGYSCNFVKENTLKAHFGAGEFLLSKHVARLHRSKIFLRSR